MERDLIIDKTIATPLYIQVANSLREKILTGKYQEGYRFPTEPEFAAMLGINHQTLRKSFQILSEQNLITQQRGKGTFVTCNTDRLYKIAVTWGKSKSNAGVYSTAIIAGVSEAFKAYRYEICHLNKIPGKSLYEQFTETNADMLIVAILNPQDEEMIRDPRFDNVPLAVINGDSETLSGRMNVSVQKDPLHDAVQRLAELGHRRIGYITLYEKTTSLLKRDNSYLNNMKKLGLDCPELIWEAPAGTTHYDAGMIGAEYLTSLKDPATAIVCPGSVISMGGWQKLTAAGYRIPEDVSIIGYDLPEWVNPYFSTMAHPHKEIAEYCGQTLLNFILKGEYLPEKEFRVTLNDRGSIAKVRKTKNITERKKR